MPKLDTDQVTQKLQALPGWKRQGDSISKLYQFKEFMGGIRFVDRIAATAERIDHHPDIAVSYTKITFTCSTHSEGGITEKDFKLASEIEHAFNSLGVVG